LAALLVIRALLLKSSLWSVIRVKSDDQKRPLDIRRLAYLYEERGCEDGHEVDDWIRAETTLNEAALKTAA